MAAHELKTEAEALRIALLSGVVFPVDVIAWADKCIAAEATPHISIIDIALAGNESVERLAFRLADVPGQAETATAIRLVLGVLFERLEDQQTDPLDVAEDLFRLARIEEWPEKELGSEPYWLDDLFQPESAFGGVYYRGALVALREYLVAHAIYVNGQSIRGK